MSGQPIDPDDIRVGDVVRATDKCLVATVNYASSDALRLNGLGEMAKAIDSDLWVRTWELVSRPQPTPEVGQHWLDTDGNEWVVVEGTDNGWFYPLRTSTRWQSRSANIAPAGWSVKA